MRWLTDTYQLSQFLKVIFFFCFLLLLQQYQVFCQPIPSSPNVLNENGQRDGKWTVLFDSNWEETTNLDSTKFFRELYYLKGTPSGKVQDYYQNGRIQWEGYLKSENPEIVKGSSTYYYKSGKISEIGSYKKGNKHGLWSLWYPRKETPQFELYREDSLNLKWSFLDEKLKKSRILSMIDNIDFPLLDSVEVCYSFDKKIFVVEQRNQLLDEAKSMTSDFRLKHKVFNRHYYLIDTENDLEIDNLASAFLVDTSLCSSSAEEFVLFLFSKFKDSQAMTILKQKPELFASSDVHTLAKIAKEVFFHGTLFSEEVMKSYSLELMDKASEIARQDNQLYLYASLLRNLTIMTEKLNIKGKSNEYAASFHQTIIEEGIIEFTDDIRLKDFDFLRNDEQYEKAYEILDGYYKLIKTRSTDSSYFSRLNQLNLIKVTLAYENHDLYTLAQMKQKIRELDTPSYNFEFTELWWKFSLHHLRSTSFYTNYADSLIQHIVEHRIRLKPTLLVTILNARVEGNISANNFDLAAKYSKKTVDYVGQGGDFDIEVVMQMYLLEGQISSFQGRYKDMKACFDFVTKLYHGVEGDTLFNLYYMPTIQGVGGGSILLPDGFKVETDKKLRDLMTINLYRSRITKSYNEHDILVDSIMNNSLRHFARKKLLLPSNMASLLRNKYVGSIGNDYLAYLFETTSKLGKRPVSRIINYSINSKAIELNTNREYKKTLRTSAPQELKAAMDSLDSVVKLLKSQLSISNQKVNKIQSLTTSIYRHQRKMLDTLNTGIKNGILTSVIDNPTCKLDTGEAIVEIFRIQDKRGDYRYHYLIQTETDTIINDIKRSGLDSLFDQYSRIASTIKEPLWTLYPIFWAEIDSCLDGISHIYFVSDGLYNRLNPETFIKPDGNFLMEKYRIDRLHSRRSFCNRFQSISTSAVTIVASGNEKYVNTSKSNNILPLRSGEYMSLKYSLSEIREIKNLLDTSLSLVNVFFNTKSFSDSLRKHLEESSIIHFATHGFVNETHSDILPNSIHSMLSTGLILTSDIDSLKVSESKLTSLEIETLNLEKAELIVLSACNSGRGNTHDGEGVLGLSRAFYSAGANHVVMSLWEMSDYYSYIFMSKLYSHIIAHHDISTAMAATKKFVMKNYPLSTYRDWGGFTLIY